MKDTEDETADTRDRPRKWHTGLLSLTFLPPPQVPTSRECVGFGAVQEVAVGLVQPASATLYDYYNPGKYWDTGRLGRQNWG